MTNAATELADLLEQWNVHSTSQTGYMIRNGANSQNTDEDWRRQIRAVQLLHEVDTALTAIEQVDGLGNPYRESFRAWAKGVFDPDHQWDTSPQSGYQVIPEADIRLLRALGDQLDLRVPAPLLDVTARTSTTAAIDELLDLLGTEDLDLDLAAERYLFELLTAIRTAMAEHDRFGTVDLRRRINELRGFLDRIADGLEANDDADLASRVRLVARRIWPWGQRAALALGFTAQTWAAVKEITT